MTKRLAHNKASTRNPVGEFSGQTRWRHFNVPIAKLQSRTTLSSKAAPCYRRDPGPLYADLQNSAPGIRRHRVDRRDNIGVV